MSKVGISLNINVAQIEKARLIDGKKGKYLNCTVFVDLDNPDQYGNNGMITQDVSKEERQSGGQGPILGNAKVFWRGEGQSKPAPQSSAPDMDSFDDDIPFN